jgi:DivIVA domain-containing protein
MDVTPRELRDLDIKEKKFGGYDPNEVDDLLERAAGRIEALESQVRDLAGRAQAGDAEAGKTRETEEMLHRTLLLAQRAADEAVAEAQAKSRQILEDAESKSRSMVSEAETNARRQAETERRRLETEVLEFGAKRDALVADIDALERYEQDYRARLRRAVEADLEMLSAKGSVAPSPRPTIHEVDLPPDAPGGAPPAVSAPAPAPAPAPMPAPAAVPPPAFGVAAAAPPEPPAAPVAEAPAPPVASAPIVEAAAPASPFAAAQSSPSAPSTEPPWEEAASTPSVARPPLFDSEPAAETDHLDDDAFFASLREAVTDETPLGPRDPAPGSTSYEQDERGGGLFRRRSR